MEYVNEFYDYLSYMEIANNMTANCLASQMRPPERYLQSELPMTMRKDLWLAGEASMPIAIENEETCNKSQIEVP